MFGVTVCVSISYLADFVREKLILRLISETPLCRARNKLTVPIEGRIEVPNAGLPVGNQEITLNGGEYSTLTRTDGSFSFYEIPSGIYLLDVGDIRATYPQAKIKVSAENGTIHVNEYKYLGAQPVQASYPIVLTALMPVQYFQKKPPISIIGMITGNPMMAMMLVMGVMVMFMPKMMANLSPEELAELKKQKQPDPMQELSKLMGGGGKGAENKDEDDD